MIHRVTPCTTGLHFNKPIQITDRPIESKLLSLKEIAANDEGWLNFDLKNPDMNWVGMNTVISSNTC